jgi:choline dehydrogenase-like flavoprotein
MDRPMRLNGSNLFEVVLASLANWLGILILVWSAAAVIVPRTLLPAASAAGGLLAGAVGASGLCLILGGGDVSRRRGALDLGLWLLGLAALALLIVGAVEGRTWSIVSGAVLLAARITAGSLRRAALRDGYRPLWFGARAFETMVATVETMLDADGRAAIPPERAAANTDRLLASADAPVETSIKWLFRALEWVLPAALIHRPLPFSTLGPRARRELVERLIEPSGLLATLLRPSGVFGSVARTMKVLTGAGYYGDPITMRAIGFREYEDGPRAKVEDLSPEHYPDPHRPLPRPVAPGARFDAVIIGSGASGSVMAYELVRRGLSVAIVERGRREDPQTFEHEELAMFPRLYKQGGLQTAADNNTAIFQGATVGGSTVINNAIWLRADLQRVLGEWRSRGAEVPEARLVQAYEELEQALKVSPIDRRVANPGTELFLRGAAKAEASGELLENNRHKCLGCGWCNYGCRYNRKTSMLVTFIPWAEALGVEVYDQVLDARVETEGPRATGVKGTREGRPFNLEADRVIVCAGAIGSSAVLLGSGITAGGRVGRDLHVLGGVFVTGDMGQVVDGFNGIGLTCTADLGAEYVLESYFAPPLAFSVRIGGWLLSHFDRVSRYRHFIDGGVMVGTDPQGSSVSLSGSEVKIDLKPSEEDIAHLKAGIKRMAQIYFAAGARRVYPSTFKYIDLTPETYERVIDEKINGIEDVLFGSAHPQGGNVMSVDPAKGVVDEGFKVHGMEGLYVADTSVWPSNIRANCQATTMAMAHYAADHVAGPRTGP